MKEDYLAALMSHTKPVKQKQELSKKDELLKSAFGKFPIEEFEELILQKVRNCNQNISVPRLSALSDWMVFDLFPKKYFDYDLSFITDQFGKSLTDMLDRGDLVLVDYLLFPSAETKANPHIGYITE